jgi:hypothetical protein
MIGPQLQATMADVRAAALRISSATIGLFMALYWLGVMSAGSNGPTGNGLRVAVTALAVVCAVGVIYPLLPHARRAPLASIAIALAVYAALGPVILNDWIRGDYDRYVWVIHQGYPCSSMGGGPGTVWVFATSWLTALAAAAYAVSLAPSRGQIVGGVLIGGLVVALTAAAMFPVPEVFATLIGCE